MDSTKIMSYSSWIASLHQFMSIGLTFITSTIFSPTMMSAGGNPLSCSTDAYSGETVGSFLLVSFER